MIEKGLDTIFTNMGFIRMNSNAPGIYLFYRPDESETAGEETHLRLISVIHAIDGNEITREQYGHILEQMKLSLQQYNPENIQLLSLILTASPENARQLCIDQPKNSHWIIDLDSLHLMLYENQYTDSPLSTELQDFRNRIEQILDEELLVRQELKQRESDYSPKAYAPVYQPPQKKYKLLSPVNTVIILLNLLVFILTYYTPVFGGTENTLSNGALSWYKVVKGREYYRIITSMFLHADLSHIFNNMLVLFFIGDNLERAAGKLKYLILYMGGGILAGITSIGYNMWKEYNQLSEGITVSIGASGAIFGVIGAMLLIVIVNRGRLEDISTRQMVFFVVLSLYGGIANTQIDLAAHVGGFLAGFVLAALIYRKPVKNTSGGEVTT